MGGAPNALSASCRNSRGNGTRAEVPEPAPPASGGNIDPESYGRLDHMYRMKLDELYAKERKFKKVIDLNFESPDSGWPFSVASKRRFLETIGYKFRSGVSCNSIYRLL